MNVEVITHRDCEQRLDSHKIKQKDVLQVTPCVQLFYPQSTRAMETLSLLPY